MLNRKQWVCWPLIAAFTAVAVGCGGGSVARSAGNSDHWGSHKCQAVNNNTGNAYLGWSTNDNQAKESALHKCQANAASQEVCRITSCIKEN